MRFQGRIRRVTPTLILFDVLLTSMSSSSSVHLECQLQLGATFKGDTRCLRTVQEKQRPRGGMVEAHVLCRTLQGMEVMPNFET